MAGGGSLTVCTLWALDSSCIGKYSGSSVRVSRPDTRVEASSYMGTLDFSIRGACGEGGVTNIDIQLISFDEQRFNKSQKLVR